MTAPGSGSGSLPPLCLLAGGLGERLGELTASTPKAALEVAGSPFVHHQLRLLAANDADRIVLCVGHLGEQVESVVGDGSEFGLTITYSRDRPGETGTASAVRGALPMLGDAFLVLYGDTYLRIEYRDFAEAFLAGGRPAQMAVLRNEGHWDSSNAEVKGETVVRYDKDDPSPNMEWIDYGLGGFRAEVFQEGLGARASDLAEVYSDLANRGELGAFPAEHRFYEIGTPEALAETEWFLASQ